MDISRTNGHSGCSGKRFHCRQHHLHRLLVFAIAASAAVFFVATTFHSESSSSSPPNVVISDDVTGGDVTVIDDGKRYVSAMCFDSRRLGNLMFNYASLLGIARSNGMTAVMPLHSNWTLPTVFDLKVLRTGHHDSHKHPGTTLSSFSPFLESRACAYDPDTEMLADSHVMLHGFYQSWRYFRRVPRLSLVEEQFVFNRRITSLVDRSRVWRDLGRAKPTTNHSTTLVGVHVRRGDYVISPSAVAYGYTIAGKAYFQRAMRYFVERYENVDFVVCSDGMEWTRRNVVLPEVDGLRSARIAYCDGGGASGHESSAADMAVLSRCDHVIMSTGTFGWWSAWLAGGSTIYYGGWPRPGSVLGQQVNKRDFFPPEWIPMM